MQHIVPSAHCLVAPPASLYSTYHADLQSMCRGAVSSSRTRLTQGINTDAGTGSLAEIMTANPSGDMQSSCAWDRTCGLQGMLLRTTDGPPLRVARTSKADQRSARCHGVFRPAMTTDANDVQEQPLPSLAWGSRVGFFRFPWLRLYPCVGGRETLGVVGPLPASG